MPPAGHCSNGSRVPSYTGRMSLQRILELAADYAGWLVAASVLSFALGLVLAPIRIVRLPADYFTYRHRHTVART